MEPGLRSRTMMPAPFWCCGSFGTGAPRLGTEVEFGWARCPSLRGPGQSLLNLGCHAGACALEAAARNWNSKPAELAGATVGAGKAEAAWLLATSLTITGPASRGSRVPPTGLKICSRKFPASPVYPGNQSWRLRRMTADCFIPDRFAIETAVTAACPTVASAGTSAWSLLGISGLNLPKIGVWDSWPELDSRFREHEQPRQAHRTVSKAVFDITQRPPCRLNTSPGSATAIRDRAGTHAARH